MGKRSNTISGLSFPVVGSVDQSYDKVKHNDISIKKGDLLLIHDKVESSYYGEIIEGGVPNAKLGWFPIMNVRIDVEEEVEPYLRKHGDATKSKKKRDIHNWFLICFNKILSRNICEE